ncbi:hypothetical protein ACI2KR_09175 [Pseudomonas luteola]
MKSKRYRRHLRHRLFDKTFMEQTRTKRCSMVMYVKEGIRRATPIFGGMFTSHLALGPESGRHSIFDNSYSFLFLSKDRSRFWNATILTGTRKYWDELSSEATEYTEKYLSDRNYKRGPSFGDKNFTITAWLESIRKEDPIAELGGKTRSEFLREYEEKLAQTYVPTIHESVVVDFGYEYGCGVTAILDVPCITKDVVEKFIRDFRSNGEQGWISERPIPAENFPGMTLVQALNKYEVPGYMIGNQVIEIGHKKHIWKP